jgi:hypothetical protein
MAFFEMNVQQRGARAERAWESLVKAGREPIVSRAGRRREMRAAVGLDRYGAEHGARHVDRVEALGKLQSDVVCDLCGGHRGFAARGGGGLTLFGDHRRARLKTPFRRRKASITGPYPVAQEADSVSSGFGDVI